MRRSSAVLAVVIGLTMAMPAARADEATPQTKGKKVALMVATLQDYYMALLNRLVIARAKDFGMEITTFTTPYDPALQSTQIDEAIARKFDMIVMIAMSENAVIPALQRAKQAKIPVVMFVAPPKPGTEELFVSFVGEDNVALGRISGQSILDALKASGRDGGNVALVTGLLAEGLAPRRVAGIKEVLASNKNVKIVAIEDAKWDPVLTEKISGQLYGRFAGQGGIDVIYGMADNMATASIQAAEAAGIKVGIGPGKMAVIGGDCFKEGIEAIKAGKMFATATQIPTWEAAKTVEVAASYFNGKPVSKYEYFPLEAITKDNLAKWEAPCTF
ncbi:ribose transport system substrate-binding protein [Rhodopseudomonas rhenobacensis]|uniref:Ribose transport system substrate-binding protein n=1 Tax=Rhodopseudomonas rhenobacensis TaxID=87461 RepID=A0A7W8E0L0_9BRAD|nr:sugar ABC transporter substrate-binding protein [Rhodopseudomonas rhenobacensis]MBB5048995.1 ribose transport system substrate-binding protein [Rhodopseudomonas rhenobacensis]